MRRSFVAPSTGRFIAAYALANAGAFLAFIPLLTLLLPLKAEQIAPSDKLLLLSTALFSGSIMASVANIIAGWISDKIYEKYKNRTMQITISLLMIFFSYYLFWVAQSWFSLIGAIIFFQFSFNFLFSPLGALLADCVPNALKGRTSAALNLAMPVATLSITILSFPSISAEPVRLMCIAITVTAAMLPILIVRHPREVRREPLFETHINNGDIATPKMDFVWAWVARFCVQFSGAVMFGYLIYYLQDVLEYNTEFLDKEVDKIVGKLNLYATPISIFGGLLIGASSDRIGRRRPFLILSSLIIGCALLSMSIWPIWPVAFPAYIFFIVAQTMFLTIDAALVTQLISGAQDRARRLGIMNLANTIPAIITPGLAIALSSSRLPSGILQILLQTAGVLAFCGAIAASRVRSVS